MSPDQQRASISAADLSTLVETDSRVVTRDGAMAVFAARPGRDGPFPVVVLYMDALGIREELRDMARRIARAGYYCVLPDLFYRTGTIRFDLSRGNAPVLPVARAIVAGLTNEMVASDTAGMIAWLRANPQASAGPMGCVGHCMSGRFVTTVMARFAQEFAAGASMYGTGVVTDEADSPHLQFGRIKGEVYFAFGERDDLLPQPIRERISDALKQAGVRYEVDVFPSAGHGFCFPCRPAYDHAVSEETWNKLFTLFERNLRSPH